ncbi:response regulator|uniref:response regulator n=1 Tax=Noviherbaspirillum sp. L7-7A TaxID=2850560 RepID=UPI001C2C57D2|nr:response regulator [Noviherbaspirillum sp. L7-7A]MBV0879534.1 response regulator [Noviherbaspirillum sp. L7-7A]
MRALIADDSRIVRATLTKHLGDLFEFSEAHDGEEAWDSLLRDEDIALLITDLTMPRLDGYGLLRRMRASKAQRLRDMPVVVVSGADEMEERRLAREAGATDLITKGMATMKLVSRLDLLAQLVIAQREHEAAADHGAASGQAASTVSPYVLQSGAERRLGYAIRQQENFALLSLSLALPEGVDHAGLRRDLEAMLRQTLRQTDAVARTGNADFTIVTSNVEPASLPGFAGRLCRAAIEAVSERHGAGAVVCCGNASLAEYAGRQPPSLHELWDAARRRAMAGLASGKSGVAGPEEESAASAG